MSMCQSLATAGIADGPQGFSLSRQGDRWGQKSEPVAPLINSVASSINSVAQEALDAVTDRLIPGAKELVTEFQNSHQLRLGQCAVFVGIDQLKQ